MILEGICIVVPSHERRLVIMELHNAHSGLTKTLLTAHQLYYLSSMHSDIKTYIDACIPCQQARPSQPRQKLLPPDPPSQALQTMRSVSVDLFSAAGQDWLTLVDCFSGYAWTAKLTSTSTRHVIGLVHQIRVASLHLLR